jgi:nicotinate-nucleotide adenylyltransferase
MRGKEKIGLFGGSFDPIHVGHMILAQRALDFVGLDSVYFIPTAIPPHKNIKALSDYQLRKRMVQLAIKDNENFKISLFEEKKETSFTYESVLFFKEKGYDRDHLHLLVGSDSIADIPYWKKPKIIYDNATIVSMQRLGYSSNTVPDQAVVIVLTAGRNSISSSEIRKLVGQDASIRYLVPREVELFIKRNSLYKQG